ncbi:MAG: alginate lyase family protein [Chloroflexota bacterium]
MTNFQHFGLYFTHEHVQNARKNQEREPFQAAWAYLSKQDIQPGTLAAIQWNGLRYRFDENAPAGEQAVIDLQTGIGLDVDGSQSDFDALAAAITLAQCFELVRDHPAWTPGAKNAWSGRFAGLGDFLNRQPETITLVERIWIGLLNVAVGIVLEDETRLQAGADVYRQVIDHEIRPEGYLPLAVEGDDGGSLWRQMLAVGGLVLTAEAASHVGLDLWNYTSRGISVVTAASYLIYYYYYSDQWRWDTLVEADAKQLFKEHGAFLEIVNYHARPKEIKLLFDDLRPFYNLTGGGLTTLSHALAARRGLFR